MTITLFTALFGPVLFLAFFTVGFRLGAEEPEGTPIMVPVLTQD